MTIPVTWRSLTSLVGVTEQCIEQILEVKDNCAFSPSRHTLAAASQCLSNKATVLGDVKKAISHCLISVAKVACWLSGVSQWLCRKEEKRGPTPEVIHCTQVPTPQQTYIPRAPWVHGVVDEVRTLSDTSAEAEGRVTKTVHASAISSSDQTDSRPVQPTHHGGTAKHTTNKSVARKCKHG